MQRNFRSVPLTENQKRSRIGRKVMKRPVAVTVLAILAVVAGIVAILDVLRYLGLLPIAALGELEFFGVSFLGAIMAAIVAGIWFWAAKMLWTLDPRGWLFTVSISLIYLIFDVLAVLGGTSWQAIAPSLIVTVLAFILCMLPGTKAAFGQQV